MGLHRRQQWAVQRTPIRNRYLLLCQVLGFKLPAGCLE
jgi:hypothetical protein